MPSRVSPPGSTSLPVCRLYIFARCAGTLCVATLSPFRLPGLSSEPMGRVAPTSVRFTTLNLFGRVVLLHESWTCPAFIRCVVAQSTSAARAAHKGRENASVGKRHVRLQCLKRDLRPAPVCDSFVGAGMVSSAEALGAARGRPLLCPACIG